MKPEGIDPNHAIPLYLQLRRWLLERINAGDYPRGSRIPSELDLARDLKMSRATVRHAIHSLVDEGLLLRVVGKGTFVLGEKTEPSLVERMTSFADDMDARGIAYSTQVLEQRIVPASAKQATLLRIAPGDPLLLLERVRSVRGEPFYIVLAHIRLDLCPGLEKVDWSTQPLFPTVRRQYSHHIARVTRSLQAVVANEREAKALKLPEGFPLHLVEDIVFLDDGRPIMLTKSRFRGDRSEFTFEVRFRKPL
jgi:DNA-binding GntR family transcriptional regulator